MKREMLPVLNTPIPPLPIIFDRFHAMTRTVRPSPHLPGYPLSLSDQRGDAATQQSGGGRPNNKKQSA